MNTSEHIISDLRAVAIEEKRQGMARFFKTGKGEYGEGDIFLGVTVPCVRRVAKAHISTPLEELLHLMISEYHEARRCALLIMVMKCEHANECIHKEILDFYLKYTKYINNWDLVDLSAPVIVGNYLADKPRDLIYKLADSHLLWENRIAIVSTMALIRRGDTDDIYALAVKMMGHRHDLIRKAIGWMLREAGKHDHKRLYDFVEANRNRMPRTMLRYAIEKFTDEERKYLMKKQARI